MTRIQDYKLAGLRIPALQTSLQRNGDHMILPPPNRQNANPMALDRAVLRRHFLGQNTACGR